MNKKPLVSVVMPVYNSANTIRRSVESILCQTFSDFEFIIVLEGKTDNKTTEILEEYAKKDTRVVLKKKAPDECLGLAISLNIGLSYSRGKYIARMDADDYSYPDRFQKQLDYMEQHPDTVVCGTKMKLLTGGNSFIPPFQFCDYEHIRIAALFENPICHPSVFIRKEYLDNTGIKYCENYVNIIPEDYDLWLRILKNGGKIENINEVLLDYTFGYGEDHFTLSRSKDKKAIEVEYCVKKDYIESVFKMGMDKYPKSLFVRYYTMYDSISNNDHSLKKSFQFLSDLEKRNEELAIFNNALFNEMIIKEWNRYVSIYYIQNGLKSIRYGDDLDMVIPKECTCLSDSFVNALARKLMVNEGCINKKIDDNFRKLKEYACNIKQVVVFGTGKVVNGFLPLMDNRIDVVAFCDNKVTVIRSFNGKPLINPSEIANYNFDHILIGSNVYYEEMENQLINDCKVDAEKISSIDILKFIERSNDK